MTILNLDITFKLYGGIHMEHTFTETSIVGEIVTQFPKASDLLNHIE